MEQPAWVRLNIHTLGGLNEFPFLVLVKSNQKVRDSTPAQTPLLQRNGSAAGGQAASQVGSGTPGPGSMGPSPHMVRRGKSLMPNPIGRLLWRL